MKVVENTRVKFNTPERMWYIGRTKSLTQVNHCCIFEKDEAGVFTVVADSGVVSSTGMLTTVNSGEDMLMEREYNLLR